MTSSPAGCPGATVEAPWASPEATLVLRADAPRDMWLAARRRGIGSSDASAILGVNRWTSPYEVWAEKRGLIAPDPGSDATELGNLLEPVIVSRWSDTTGIPIRKAGLMRSRVRPWQLASVDRLAGCGGLVEAKALSWRMAEEWEDGQTPDHAEAQVQHQLAVTGRSHAHVVGLQDGRTWLERTIARDGELIADMVDIEARFWGLVVDGIEPPIDGSSATTEALERRWHALTEIAVDLPAEAFDLVAARLHADIQLRDWKQLADTASNKLRGLMGEATVGYLPGQENVPEDKRKAVTWRRNGTFRAKDFAGDHPDVAAAITHPLPALDVDALKGGRPELYAAYRARVLRVPKL